MRVRLGPPEGFEEGKLTLVDLRTDEGQLDEAVVWRWRDRLYAVRNHCSHQGARLCHGWLVPRIVADREGEIDRESDVPLLRCPRHRWEYDPATGRSLVDPSAKLKVWPVVVEDGDAFLELAGSKRTNVTAVVRKGVESEGGRA